MPVKAPVMRTTVCDFTPMKWSWLSSGIARPRRARIEAKTSREKSTNQPKPATRSSILLYVACHIVHGDLTRNPPAVPELAGTVLPNFLVLTRPTSISNDANAMHQVKIFKGLESNLPALETEINEWLAKSGVRILQVFGNL